MPVATTRDRTTSRDVSCGIYDSRTCLFQQGVIQNVLEILEFHVHGSLLGLGSSMLRLGFGFNLGSG